MNAIRLDSEHSVLPQKDVFRNEPASEKLKPAKQDVYWLDSISHFGITHILQGEPVLSNVDQVSPPG